MSVRILLVGEAWGSREELFEHAFVGASGQELARMLLQVGLAPDLPHPYPSELEMIGYWAKLEAEHGIAVANVFDMRPQDNQIDLCFCSAREGGLTSLPPYRAGKYIRPEMLEHVHALWAKVEGLWPNLVIAFGNTACWALFGQTKISDLRGTVVFSPRLKVKVLPTYHPAAVLREWPLRTIVIKDLEKAVKEAENSTVSRIERWLTVDPTLAEIEAWMQRPAEFYAVDIENPKIMVGKKPSYLRGQIAMIGFARAHNDALVIPFFDPDCPGGNFWPTWQDEFRAMKFAQKLLASPVPKVFQNGVFDLSHLLRLGFRPINCQHDTMLLHHALYPEMRKSLGFLGSVYSDEIAWKTMSGKGNNLKRDE